MRAIVERLGAVPVALAQDVAVGQSSCSTGDVNGSSTGKVKTAKLIHPAGRVPGPASNRVVDQGSPYHHEHHAW